MNPTNASRLAVALQKFGFASAGATKELFLATGKVVRMGVPPVRIELLSSLSGVAFAECAARRINAVIDGVAVPLISKEDLLINKRAAGRPKDLNDLAHLNPPG